MKATQDEAISRSNPAVEQHVLPREALDETRKVSRASPFLRWVGGKRKLLHELLPRVPASSGAYHEPFLGGGALFFELHHRGLLAGKQIVLADAAPELVNTYLIVRDRVDDLIEQLEALQALPHDAANFYQIRAQAPAALSDIDRAARFVYLNKRCVNGICRVNKYGVFNTPIGSYKKPPRLFEPDVLHTDSQALRGVAITCADFVASLRNVRPGDFVYIDPPYDEAKFTEYTPGGFSRQDQARLAVEFDRLAALGAYVMMSNSDTGWVRQRYATYRQELVMAPRSVNSDGRGRGLVPELIIIGWEPSTGAASTSAPTSAEVRP